MAYLKGALEKISKIDISDIVAEGLEGAEIGRQLTARQLAALTEHKETFSL